MLIHSPVTRSGSLCLDCDGHGVVLSPEWDEWRAAYDLARREWVAVHGEASWRRVGELVFVRSAPQPGDVSELVECETCRGAGSLHGYVGPKEV